MADQFDVSSEQQKLMKERAQRRLALRHEFQKLRYDPFRDAAADTAVVFDPALMRYQSARLNMFEYFRPNINNGLKFVGLFILPLAAGIYLLKKDRDTREQRLRNGEVAYKDRQFKFI